MMCLARTVASRREGTHTSVSRTHYGFLHNEEKSADACSNADVDAFLWLFPVGQPIAHMCVASVRCVSKKIRVCDHDP